MRTQEQHLHFSTDSTTVPATPTSLSQAASLPPQSTAAEASSTSEHPPHYQGPTFVFCCPPACLLGGWRRGPTSGMVSARQPMDRHWHLGLQAPFLGLSGCPHSFSCTWEIPKHGAKGLTCCFAFFSAFPLAWSTGPTDGTNHLAPRTRVLFAS